MRTWRGAAAVLVATLVVLAAACGSDDGGATGDGTTTTAEVPTTGSATGSTPATTGDTQPSRPTTFAALASDAVAELKAAWEAGDQDRARAIAPGEVVDALFTVQPGGFETYGCDTGEFETSTCNYRNRATGMFIVVTAQRSEQGWQIATILLNQD